MTSVVLLVAGGGASNGGGNSNPVTPPPGLTAQGVYSGRTSAGLTFETILDDSFSRMTGFMRFMGRAVAIPSMALGS